ncbi:uncharacterized protein METZ01_LOCUS418002 [marine metagenome]|uniref:Uncharacterized protein n=1 Tax=marine metagenome TaxID=408172 RepID=A0A382X453_9ZZZZ
METYKLIRKICLVLTAIGLLTLVIDDFNNPYASNSEAVLWFFIIFIAVYICFEVISKIIQAVKKDTGKMKVFNDKKYLEAFSEVEENNIQNKELWAKAFAQCGGDKEKQKSIYVELRTKELSKR